MVGKCILIKNFVLTLSLKVKIIANIRSNVLGNIMSQVKHLPIYDYRRMATKVKNDQIDYQHCWKVPIHVPPVYVTF